MHKLHIIYHRHLVKAWIILLSYLKSIISARYDGKFNISTAIIATAQADFRKSVEMLYIFITAFGIHCIKHMMSFNKTNP